MPNNKANQTSFKEGNSAAVKHGVISMINSGPDKLKPEKVTRLVELREMVGDQPGRIELRRELTARMALICELGFSHLREQAESGEDVWQGGIIRRLATYVAETRRLLDSFQNDMTPGLNAERERIIKVLDDDTRNGTRKE